MTYGRRWTRPMPGTNFCRPLGRKQNGETDIIRFRADESALDDGPGADSSAEG